MADMNHTFKVGDQVVVNDEWFFDFTDSRIERSQVYSVEAIEDVPPEQIKYNDKTHEGGVEHHQWITVMGRTYSGLLWNPAPII